MTGDHKQTIIALGTGAGVAQTLASLAGAPVRPTELEFPWRHEPAIVGTHGKAWRCNEQAGLEKLGLAKDRHAGLVHWIVHAPYAHPAWHSYSVICMHLRPIEGMGAPKLYLPLATHELLVHALNPDCDLNLLIDDGIRRGEFLTPTNFAAQFVETDDELADQRIERTIREICTGALSPDTDHLRDWIARFGDNMIKLAFR
jgi:hypothetical protein